MWIDKDLLPHYLKAVKEEYDEAIEGRGGFADGNGLVYLSDAISKLETSLALGIDHTSVRWQTWGAISSVTPSILASGELSDEQYGKMAKLFWITNLHKTIKDLEELPDDYVKANIPRLAEWAKWIIGSVK
jgi:hypothetical protein